MTSIFSSAKRDIHLFLGWEKMAEFHGTATEIQIDFIITKAGKIRLIPDDTNGVAAEQIADALGETLPN